MTTRSALLPVTRLLTSIRHMTFADLVAGCVISLVLAGFGAAFSSAIFDEVGLDRYVSVARGTQSVSIFVTGFAVVLFSDMGLVIGAPDVTPSVFFATMAATCRTTMIAGTGLAQPDPDQLMTTILACIIISTTLLGVLLIVLGNLRLTRVIQLLPTSVLCGFMASIGYTICEKALMLSMPEGVWNEGPSYLDWWRLSLPALLLGCLMFLQARFKVGKNIIAMPLLMLAPLVLFYVVVFATGEGVGAARQNLWFLNTVQLNQSSPALLYTESYGSAALVRWDAVQAAVPSMFLLFLVVLCDLLLKLSGVRKALGAFDCRVDHEVILAGKINLVSGFLVGAPGYIQPGLTNISAGVVRDRSSRVPGLIGATFNLALFASGFPIVTYLPRFWLSGMLFFAGIQLLVENIIDSHPKVSQKEWSAIIVIVIINAVSSLGWSVLAGVVLSASIFAIAYGRGGSIKEVMSGVSYRSTVIRSTSEDAKLEHLGNKVLIIVLHRYLFFGSVASVTEQAAHKRVDRVEFYVFDWDGVEDIDATAVAAFSEIVSKLRESNLEQPPTILFTAVHPAIRRKLATERVIASLHNAEFASMSQSSASSVDDDVLQIPLPERRVFDNLDFGMEWVENRMLARATELRQHWNHFEALRRLHVQAVTLALNETNEHVLGTRLGGILHPYLRAVPLNKGDMLLKAGDVYGEMFLVQNGRVTLWMGDSAANMRRVRSVRAGAFINEEALYSDDAVVCAATVIADADSLVLGLGKTEVEALDRELPTVAIELHRKILKSIAATRRKLEKVADDLGDVQVTGTALDATAQRRKLSRQERFAQSLVKVAQSPMRALEDGLVLAGMKQREGGEESGLLDFEAMVEGDASGRRIARVMAKHSATTDPAAVERLASPDRERETLDALAAQFDLSDPTLRIQWSALTSGTSTVNAEQLARVLKISRVEADEVVWEADVAERGSLTFSDVLRAVTTVTESEVGAAAAAMVARSELQAPDPETPQPRRRSSAS